MPEWRVQLWLGECLIEEHIAPAELAQEYAKVIRLRIQGLPNRHLRCEPVTVMEQGSSRQQSVGAPATNGPTIRRGRRPVPCDGDGRALQFRARSRRE